MRALIKSTISGLLLMVIIVGCDSREDYFASINKAPIMVIKKNGTVIESNSVDSVKSGFQYLLTYELTDEEALSLDYTINGDNNGHISNDNASEGIFQLQYQFSDAPTEASENMILTFKAKDTFDSEATQTINLVGFINLPPVTNFKVTKLAVVSPNEVEIDASASYDKDSKYGGAITDYEYTINTYTFISPLSKIKYIFGTKGTKSINVRVKDNNGVWSQQKTSYFVLD